METLNGRLKIRAIVFPQMDQMDFTAHSRYFPICTSSLTCLPYDLRSASFISVGTAFLPDDLSKARASKDHGLWGHLSYLRALLAASEMAKIHIPGDFPSAPTYSDDERVSLSPRNPFVCGKVRSTVLGS
jgi:hypothetical protein